MRQTKPFVHSMDNAFINPMHHQQSNQVTSIIRQMGNRISARLGAPKTTGALAKVYNMKTQRDEFRRVVRTKRY